jgi:ribonuclease HI
VVLISPRGANFEFSFPIEASATNSQVEYRAILNGIQLLREIKADAVEIFGDSMLVINQLFGEYECKDDILRLYHEECLRLLKEFKKVTIEHVLKFHNSDANRLAQHASGYRLMEGVMALGLAAGGRHLHVIGELLKSPPVLAALHEVNRLDLQGVMAGLELGCGEGHSGAVADPMSDDVPDAARDVLQMSGDGVAASIHRSDGGGCCGMEGRR